MPLYEYQCKKCGHRFEKIQKFSDRPIKKCPECGGPAEKLLSSPAVRFKRSGRYVTEYAKKGAPAGGDSGSQEKKDEKPKTETASKESSSKETSSKKAEKHK